VADLLRSIAELDQHLVNDRDSLGIQSRHFDKFATALASDRCWFGALQGVNGFEDLRTALADRIHTYRAFMNFNIDRLPEPFATSKSAVHEPIGEAVELTSEDVGISWLPLYHDMGLIGAWLTLLHYGTPLCVMSPLAFLTRPERWLQAFHKHRGTIAAAPNFAYELCVRKIADKDIEGVDLSSWRAALNGAEPVNPETLERFERRFAKYGFRREAQLPVYGLAEASLAVTFPPINRGPLVDYVDRETFTAQGQAIPVPPDSNTIAFVSSGKAVANHEVRIVDNAGQDVSDRTEGFLWFRGPSATSGSYTARKSPTDGCDVVGRSVAVRRYS